MEIGHKPHNKQRRLEPSLWVDEPTDDAFSLLENALQGDEPTLCRDDHADEVHSLLEENARLRELLVQLTDLVRKNDVRTS